MKKLLVALFLLIMASGGMWEDVLAPAGKGTAATQPSVGKRSGLDEIREWTPSDKRGDQIPLKGPLTPEQLFKKVSPAVAKIVIKNHDDKPIGSGSGFFVADSRHSDPMTWTMITNYHVIRPAVGATVEMADGQKAEVMDVLAENETSDLALLAVWSAEEQSFKKRKAPLALGIDATERLSIGTRVFAISSPKGYTNTLTEGLVSGYRRGRGENVWMQISAPISPGSSGGSILTADGAVVGVASSCVVDGQNLNFAVPVGDVTRLLAGPRTPRPIWRGASIANERYDAKTTLNVELVGRYYRGGEEQHKVELSEWLERLADQGNQDALLNRAFRHLDSKDYAAAITTLKRAVEAEPGPREYLVYYAMGEAQHYLALKNAGAHKGTWKNDMSLAISALRESAKLKSGFAPSTSLLQSAYEACGRYPEALAAAESLVHLLPRCSAAYQVRASSYSNLDQDECAVEDYRFALDLDPADALAYVNMAGCYDRLGQSGKSVEACKQAIGLNSSSFVNKVAYKNMGSAYCHCGEHRRALEAYEKALELGQMTPIDGEIRGAIMDCRIHLSR